VWFSASREDEKNDLESERMVPRDKLKTERNKLIRAIDSELNELLPLVLLDANLPDQQTLNGIIGSKAGEFIDLHNDIISGPEQFVTVWMDAWIRFRASTPSDSKYNILFNNVRRSPDYIKYLHLFLRRSFLKRYEEFYRPRPTVGEAEVWIGQNHANYGLLVTPRFADGEWENDKSEIRRFKPRYWSIGHVLETGLVLPGKNETMTFSGVAEYLRFFKNVLVRGAASDHQDAIAELYSQFVEASDKPLDVPLLIPEYRYGGAASKHQYRLDFTVIHPFTMDKVGFELSPWSSHGRLTGLKTKTQKAVNQEAASNFHREVAKQKAFFKTHGVTVLIYTDPDLADIQQVFDEISVQLKPESDPVQYSFKAFEDYFK